MYRRAPHSKYARYILKQVYGIYREKTTRSRDLRSRNLLLV